MINKFLGALFAAVGIFTMSVSSSPLAAEQVNVQNRAAKIESSNFGIPVFLGSLTFTFFNAADSGAWRGVLTTPSGETFATDLLGPNAIYSQIIVTEIEKGTYTVSFYTEAYTTTETPLGVCTVTNTVNGDETSLTTGAAWYNTRDSENFVYAWPY